jgi:hypothetical protein
MVILKRNYDVYISKAPDATADSTNTVKLLVTDLSFNQASSLTQVGRETLDATQERVVAPHTSDVAPVNFSLTTYILPLVDTNVTSPEEYLWTSLMGSDSIAGSPNSTPTSSTIDFSEGNVGSLHNLTLWFIDPNNSDASYRLDNAIIDSATIDFDINSIASITWEGRALTLSRDSIPPSGAIDRTTVDNCIKTRLSTITFDSYTLALTGGSIKFENNVQFYGRSQLGKTTTPVGHYTQNRTITGNLTFYMKQGTNLSADLYDTILSNADADNYETTNAADITINVGGTTAPYIAIDVPRAILEIPNLQFDEIISLDVPFTAKEGTGFYSSVIYYAT